MKTEKNPNKLLSGLDIFDFALTNTLTALYSRSDGSLSVVLNSQRIMKHTAFVMVIAKIVLNFHH